MTHLPHKVLIMLLLISRRHFLPSSSKRLAKFSLHVFDLQARLAWSQTKAAPCLELKSYRKVHKRHYKHSQEQVVSSWMGSMYDISTYITSRDSTLTCTHLKKHKNMKTAALRENYRHNGTITGIRSTVTVLLETAGSVIAHVWPQEAEKYSKTDCGRTLRASVGGTYGGGLLNGTATGIGSFFL